MSSHFRRQLRCDMAIARLRLSAVYTLDDVTDWPFANTPQILILLSLEFRKVDYLHREVESAGLAIAIASVILQL